MWRTLPTESTRRQRLSAADVSIAWSLVEGSDERGAYASGKLADTTGVLSSALAKRPEPVPPLVSRCALRLEHVATLRKGQGTLVRLDRQRALTFVVRAQCAHADRVRFRRIVHCAVHVRLFGRASLGNQAPPTWLPRAPAASWL